MSAQQPSITRAAAWMLGVLLSFVLMAIAARELAGDLHTFQILFIRSVIGILLLSVLVARQGWHRLRTDRLGLHLLRNCSHFAGQFGWFYAVGFIPLSVVFAIEMTTPLWTAFFASLLLAEKLTASRLLAIFTGLVGVVIILRPGMGVMHPAALAVVVAAIMYGMTHTTTKKLSGTESSLTILFYMMLMQFVMALIPAGLVWEQPRLEHTPWLLLIGVAGISAHYCLIRALLHADATVVIPMDFLRLPMVTIAGYLLYDEQLDHFLILGATLVLVGLLINLFAEKKVTNSKGQS